jgi:hypothetical protein
MKIIWKALLVLCGVLAASLAVWVVFFLKQDITMTSARKQVLMDQASSKSVVIFFNGGGWGNTPLAEATDFTPILAGIQDSLMKLGYSSVIIPFERTPAGLTGKIEDVKDYLQSFKYSSQAMANEIQFVTDSFPGKQVLIAGFSNGGGLSDKTMKRLEGNLDVNAIIAGVPRWYQNYNSDSILVLTNSGKDKLSAGNINALTRAVIEAPFKYVQAKIQHRPLNFARSIQIPGHEYLWSSPEVGPPIVNFLRKHFAAKITIVP